MENNNGTGASNQEDIYSLVDKKISSDTDFQTEIETLSDEEKETKLSEKKTELIKQMYATIAEKAKKDAELADNYKIRAEKAERTPKESKKSDELDYGQKAFLAANDIKVSDEVNLVKTIMKDTGKTLEQVLESKYFQAELKEIRELKQSADAMPSKTKRSTNSAKDSVDYWIAKGELPPEDQLELRRKVIAERRKKDSTSNPFRK